MDQSTSKVSDRLPKLLLIGSTCLAQLAIKCFPSEFHVYNFLVYLKHEIDRKIIVKLEYGLLSAHFSELLGSFPPTPT